jgi:signal-transduction protein with cAMP-binding, CBS, and nucleotidyltransferase domain
LLAPDQDNALVLDPPPEADMTTVDAWFADFAARVTSTIDTAGVPFCRGGVMASEAPFRRTLAGWRLEIARWIARPDGTSVLAADIFFDFTGVAGDLVLAATLRREANAAVTHEPAFLQQLASGLDGANAVTGWFGRFRLTGGRIDLKLGGLLPIVSGMRVLALRHGIAATGTGERMAALVEKGALRASDAADIDAARATIVDTILRQQLADIAAGRTPGTRVDPSRLDRASRRALRTAVASTALMTPMVESALASSSRA